MLKVKNMLLLLLTVVLLTGGSLLPVVAARVQDQTITNVVQYENMEALQLKLEEKVLSMTYPEKMILMTHGAGIEASDENTNLKDEQVMETVYAAITPYMELFLGDAFDNDRLEYYPIMVYNESDPSRYAYYWHVRMSLDMSLHDNISVLLDDETGKILGIDMIDPELQIDSAYLKKQQEALAAIYFHDLGIEPSAQWPVETEPADKKEVTGISLVATEYLLVDAVYGEAVVQIGVRTDGFYIDATLMRFENNL